MLKPGDVVDVNEILAYYGEYLPEYEYVYGVVEYVEPYDETVLLIGIHNGPEISVQSDLEVNVYGQVPYVYV